MTDALYNPYPNPMAAACKLIDGSTAALRPTRRRWR